MNLKKWLSSKQKFGVNEIVTLTLSVLTGIMIWIYVDSRRTEERVINARLEVTVPPGWRMVGGVRPTVQVALRGPRTIMGGLTSDEVRFYRALEVPAGAASSQEIHIELTRDDLRGLPRDIAVLDIPDSSVKVNIIRPVRRYLPVELQFKGEVSKDYERKGYDFSPEFIAVYAAQDEFTGNDVAKTVPINLKDHTTSFGTYIDLEPVKLKNTTIFPEESIFVQVNISEKKARVTIEKIPVSILLATPLEKLSGGKLIPSQVSVTIEGGAQSIKSLTPGAITVYIDTKDMGSSVQGEYVLRCRTLVPEGVKVLSVSPEEVRWVIPKITPAVPETGSTLKPVNPQPVAGASVGGIKTEAPGAINGAKLGDVPGAGKKPAAVSGNSRVVGNKQ